jgi:hypothetical protein
MATCLPIPRDAPTTRATCFAGDGIVQTRVDCGIHLRNDRRSIGQSPVIRGIYILDLSFAGDNLENARHSLADG